MPIVKRSSVPSPLPAQQSDFRLPGRPLYELLRETRKQASDAHWEGNHKEGARLDLEANQIAARIEAGELYEVDH